MNGSFAENEFINLNNAKYNTKKRNIQTPAAVKKRVYNDYKSGYNGAVKRSAYNRSASKSEYTVGAAVGELVATAVRNARRAKSLEPSYSIHKVKAKPFPFGFVLSAAIITVTFMFIACNYSVVNEISYETADLEDEIEYYTKENEVLSVQLEKKNDLAEIEKIASEKLGMVKSTDVYKQYVSLSGSDKTVVSEGSSASYNLGTTLNGFKRSVGKIFE